MYENEAFLKTKFMAYDTVLRPRNCNAPECFFLFFANAFGNNISNSIKRFFRFIILGDVDLNKRSSTIQNNNAVLQVYSSKCSRHKSGRAKCSLFRKVQP